MDGARHQGRMGVRVDQDGYATFMPVKPVQDAPDGIWVTGLPETVDVIIVGQEFVRDGRAIIGTVADLNTLQLR